MDYMKLKLCDAIVVVQNLQSEKLTDETKGLAILRILEANTLNSVTKNDMKNIIKWLFEKCYEVRE